MTTTLTVGARLSALFFIFVFYSTAFAGSAKVDVCHIPPDDPENFHTIRINEKALSAHLAHGDFASACNALCATICDDSDACTVDDTMDCEEQGCPTFPRDQVDCSDEQACTDDSCDVVNGCVNEPVVCTPSNLCKVPMCAEPSGECIETDVVCNEFEVCDLNSGECVTEEPLAPCLCFTLEELEDGGEIDQCGENFLGFPDMAGAMYTDRNNACSGINCLMGSVARGCGYTVTGIMVDNLTPEEDQACRNLILANCDSPNQPASEQAQSAEVADGSAPAFIDQ